MKLTSFILGIATLVLAATTMHPVRAAGPFDGVYNGTYINSTVGGGGCPDGGNASRQVVDSAFTNRWNGTDIKATVGADGTIIGGGNMGSALLSIKGKIAGNLMTYDIGSQRCSYHFEGRRR